MSATTILQYLSAFSIIIPFSGVLYYWFRRNFKNKNGVNVLGTYIVLATLVQGIMMYLSFNGVYNISVVKYFVLIEFFLLSYFLFSHQSFSGILKILLSVALTLIIFSVNFYWGDKNQIPIESTMVESLFLTIIGMITIPEIRFENENSTYYFVFAIMVYSVNNLIGYGFLQIAPGFSLTIQAFVNITTNLLFTWGFYLLLKETANN